VTVTIEQLAALILTQSRERLARQYGDEQASAERVEVKPGPKYTKIDRGPGHNMSGFLMVENATGAIYGIKGYGRVHKGHAYGTLATTDQWYWGDYCPRETEPGDRSAAAPEGAPVMTAEATYYHPSAGALHAVRATEVTAPGVPAMADWAVLTTGGRIAGFVTDTRADAGADPSAKAPADDDAAPFESYTGAGQFITVTHSLRGALAAAGNHA